MVTTPVVNSILKKYNTIPKYAWNDNNFIKIYNHNLSDFFKDYTFIGEEIEKQSQTTCEKINNAAILAMEDCFPQKESGAYSKSWWTPEIKSCKDILSFHFKEWKKDNFSKSQECSSFNKYKLARKNFRKIIKAAHNLKINKITKNIESLQKSNPQKFWNNIRKFKSNPNTHIFTINKKQDKKEIVEEFRQNFSTILNTPTITNNNNKHRRIPQLIDEPNKILISTSDIETCILKLRSNRSRDSCGITAEHLKYSYNNNLLTWLSKFYINIFNNGAVPEYLSTSIIVPIMKSYKISLDNPDNYRGISIVPILTKLFEYIIMEKCPEISDSHSHQFGFKHNSSTLHAEFLLSETIKHYNNNNSSIYICSLDANKAFELYYNKKLSLSVVRTLQSLYLSGTASISYLGHKSNHFRLSQGVRQRSILSPHLYNLYIQSILNQIVSDSKVGTTISGVYTGIIAYADNIILLSPTLSGLQELVNKVQSNCQNLYIKLNTEKAEFIISGKSSITKNSIQINGFLWDNQNNTKNIAAPQTLNVNERIIQYIQ
ncbi:uncharacterized protein LOC136096659 [Hydra vulgaris]|uniref:uncharacterized protein LOC136096659 n=1 Tax=Hydra vulgaris TaxID=6087 RepID=UPI0032E9D913